MVRYRKSKTFGGLRVTASRRGIGASMGTGPFRVSLGSDGRVRRTVRVPGTGISDTKVVGSNRRPSTARRDGKPAKQVTKLRIEITEDNSPPATGWQRRYVKARLSRAQFRSRIDRVPKLNGLTIGQAEQILATLGDGAAPLYRGGRAWGAAGRATVAWRDAHLR